MISDLNKIYIKGGVKVNQNTMPILCFVDGKAINNRMYSLVNRELNIYTESTEYITLTYGYNDAKVYNFNVVLDNYGTIIEKYDMNGEWLQGLSPNKMLVFVDGRLLEDDEYELLGQDAASTLIFTVESTPYPSYATAEQTSGTGLVDLEVDVETLEENFSPTGDYIGSFIYSNAEHSWIHYNEPVDISEYGISYIGTPDNNDEITLHYHAPSQLTYDDVRISKATFETQTRTSGVYAFSYNGTNWLLGDSSEVVDINDYGIRLTKNPHTDDIINITYTAEKTSAIALRFKIPGDDFHSVIIYSCKTNIDTGYFNAPSGTTIPCSYNRDRYLIFKNGYLIPNKDIYVSTGNESIIINNEYTSGDIIKYVILPNSTQSINFATERGFLTYGPEDDYFKTLPLDYNYELVFESNAVNIIDDIRTGFILASDEYNSEFLIVDDNFNKNKIKALGLNNPIAKYYRDGEFYLLVPECRKITEYLSDFDKSGKLIPEILEVFQRFLLDEFHDEIQRLRNIRNLSKVDSLHIDKLLKFLGSNLDLKNKSLLQKRAILEELTSFYRILGTKNCYNIFNISDTSIGLENLEQLFTIRNNASPNSTKKITKITTSLGHPGQGYLIGNEYLLKLPATETEPSRLTNIKIKVTNTDSFGGITSIAPQVNETVGELDIPAIDTEYNVVSVGDNACFDIESKGILYNYDANQTTPEEKQSIASVLPEGHSMVCQAIGYPGDVTFKKTGPDYTDLQIKLSVTSGTKPLNLVHTKVTRNLDNIGCTIHSAAEYSDAYVFNSSTPSNSPSSITLAPGMYYYEMSGGGGGGGAADSTVGDTADIPSYQGSNAEFLSGVFYVPQESVVQVYVGGGGQGSYARGHEPYECGAPGVGYHQGKYGVAIRKSWTRQEHVHYWHHLHRKSRVDTITEYDTIATGSGGGSSAIVVNGRLTREARGGKGGACVSSHSTNSPTFNGGNGGGGSYNIGNGGGGAKGGYNSPPNNSFTSGAGGNGWVRIKRATARYSLVLDNLLHENINIGDQLKTGVFSQLLPSTIRVVLRSETINNVQINKKTFEDKVHPTVTMDYIFRYNGFSWELGGTPNIRLSEYGIIYEGIPNTGNTITVKYTAQTGADEFVVTITGYDAVRGIITQYDYTPKYGDNFFTQKEGNVLINDSTNGNDVHTILYPNMSEMYMTIVGDEPQKFRYNLTLDETNNISRNYQVGDVLHFLSQDPNIQEFDITVDEINLAGGIKKFHFVPTTGTHEINAAGLETTMQNGTGATIWISSETQTLAEANTVKEYVDFFTKEELGAIHKTEYRLEVTDYGLLSEGTPNSPYPWTMGDPDEDYGETINEGGLVTQDDDYGYVRDPVKGKWYQWWEWERDPNYYPTNHIEVTLSPKSSSALNDSLERFFSQFYKIASTVLYIHRVIANYRFGNESIFSINEDGTINGSILFGFMSGQPITYDKYFLTNDPERQVRI